MTVCKRGGHQGPSTVENPLQRDAGQARFYYGWYVVAACFVSQFIQAGVGFYAFGVFFSPIEKEFGWHRATISAAMSLGAFLSGLGGPLIGRWTDTLGPRKVMITGTLIMGGGLIALYGVTDLWQLYAAFITATMGRIAMASIPVGAVLSSWFRHRRGMALGIAATGIGIGGMLMAPFAEVLISHIGWREAIAALGLLTIGAVVPLVAFLVRRTPQEKGLLPYGEVAEDPKLVKDREALEIKSTPRGETLTSQQALRTPAFWMIGGSLLLISLGQGTVLLHIVPFLTDQGTSPSAAAAVLALASGMGGVGKFSMGYASDKIPARFAMVFGFLLQALGLVIIMLPMNPLTIPAFVVFYGVGMGGTVALQPVIVAETFGIGSLGMILGSLTIPSTFSQAVGPILAGYIFDTTNNYMIAFGLFTVTAILAALTVARARPVIGAKKNLPQVAT